MTDTSATISVEPATRHDLWRALHTATDGHDMPVPRYVQDIETVLPGAAPLLVVRLDHLDEAQAWAEHLGMTTSGVQHHERPGLVGVSFMGDWMGWRVLILADEDRPMPTVEQVVEAVLQS